MKSLIIYGSQYGSAQHYAAKFAQTTNIPIMNYKNVRSLADYQLIIYFGALYAGGVMGLKKTASSFPKNAKIIIATVGIADVNNKENTANIKGSLSKQVTPEIFKNAQLFYLRGALDYKKLNFKHKTMMTLLYHKLKKCPEEELSAEDKELIASFNKKVDFIDYNSLKPIAEVLNFHID